MTNTGPHQKVRGSVIARNTAFNLGGNALPLLVGLVAVPFIVKGLGTERFGLLALCWVVLAYFGMFDMGLSRAATKAVAETLSIGDTQRLPVIVGTCLAVHAVAGAVGGLLMGILGPLLVERVLRIPVALMPEAKQAMIILAFAVPIVVVSAAARGVLEAAQRFDLVNMVKAPANSLIFVIPALAAPLGLGLVHIVLWIVVARFASLVVYTALCFRALPSLREGLSVSTGLMRPLLAFGSWVTVSNIIGPILNYLDRFLIASVLSVAAVTYYVAPSEIVTRVWILPWSLVSTLFPALSALGAGGDRSHLEQVYARSIKTLLLIMGLLALVFVALAEVILRLWLGPEFAQRSALVLQILSVGVLSVSVGNIPYTFLQSLGRPDVTAKFHLLEFPLYVGLAWWLIGKMGIVGAAVAWSGIMTLDLILLLSACWRIFSLSPQLLATNGIPRAILTIIVTAGVAVLPGQLFFHGVFPVDVTRVTLLLGLFSVLTFAYVLDSTDRDAFASALSYFRTARSRTR